MADIRDKPIEKGPEDFKDIPTHECGHCGSRLFYILACFDDYQVAGYYTDAVCYGCNAYVKVPTELDRIEDD